MKFISPALDKAYQIVATAPTTNIRILLTLAITLGTAIKYWASTAWVPDWQWLVFLAGMAGLDVWQHMNKRRTSWSPVEHAEAARIQNGHGAAEELPSTEEEDERG